MFARLKRFFGSPPGENDATSVRARLLSRVLNVHVMVALSVAAFYPSDNAGGRALVSAALATIPLALLMRAIMHRGSARAASWLFLILLSLTVPSLSIYVTGSVALVSVSIFQMMLIVMAGLLLGGKEAIAFAALIVVSNGLLFRMESLALPDRAAALYAASILQLVFYIATAALLARANGALETLASTAPALGLIERWTAREAQIELRPGDTLLIYSDGVTEARRVDDSDAAADGVEFGEGRLAESLLSRRLEPPADLPARLLAEVEAFAGPEPQDDRTLVVLRART